MSMSWSGTCFHEYPSMEDLCSFIWTWWVLQKQDVYLSQVGVGSAGGPGSITDPVEKSTALVAAARETSCCVVGQCVRRQRVSRLISRWPQVRGLKLWHAGRRGLLGTVTVIVPWRGAARFRASTSLWVVVWSCCLPRICGCLSELWVVAVVKQLFAFTFMKSCVLVVLGFLVHADLELTGEQSLSRLQVTPPLERSVPGGRSRETPSSMPLMPHRWSAVGLTASP